MNISEIKSVLNRLRQHHAGEYKEHLYAIIDTARDDIIYRELRNANVEKGCLLMGDQARNMASVAPYLVRFETDNPFSDWVLKRGWGESWGLFAQSPASFLVMKNHFRKFLRVIDEDGNTLFFRYYDPRVMRIFLPTCNAAQLEDIFGPVTQYYVEGEQFDTMRRYSLSKGKLAQELISLNPTGTAANPTATTMHIDS